MLHRELIAVYSEIHNKQESQKTNKQTHSVWTKRRNLLVKSVGV